MKLTNELLFLLEAAPIKVPLKVLSKIKDIPGVVSVEYDEKPVHFGSQLMDIETKTGFLQFLLGKNGGSTDSQLSKKNGLIAKEVLAILKGNKIIL